MNRLQQKYSRQVDFKLLDADDPSTSPYKEKFGLQYLPTFIFLSQSGQVIDQVIGAVSEEELEQKIQDLLK